MEEIIINQIFMPTPSLVTPDDEKNLEAYTSDVGEIVGRVSELKITTKPEMETASGYLGEIKSAINGIESKRKERVKPLTETTRWINNGFKALTAPLVDAEREIKDKMAIFVDEEEKKAEEEAKAAPKGAEPALATETSVRTGAGLTSAKKVWRFKMVDEAKIPREFLILDTIVVRKAIADGNRTIPGLEVYQETEISHRI